MQVYESSFCLVDEDVAYRSQVIFLATKRYAMDT
jgi:hypothetical protein